MSKGLHRQPHTSIYIDATLPPGIHYAPSYDKRRNRVYPRFRVTWIGPGEQYKRNKSFVFASIHVDEYPIGLRDVSVYRIARALHRAARFRRSYEKARTAGTKEWRAFTCAVIWGRLSQWYRGHPYRFRIGRG
jgi:hypothetical protein